MLFWLLFIGVLAWGSVAQETGGSGSESQEVVFSPPSSESESQAAAFSPPSSESESQVAVSSPSSSEGDSQAAVSPPQGLLTPSGEFAPPPPIEVTNVSGGEEYAPSIDNFLPEEPTPYALNAPPPVPAKTYGPPGYAPPPLAPSSQPELPAFAPSPPPPSPEVPYSSASPALAPPPPSPPAAPAVTYGTPRADVLDSLDEDPAPTSTKRRYVTQDGTVVTNELPNDGNFRFSYRTPDGSSRTEIGTKKYLYDGAPPVVVVRGSYTYTTPEGVNVRIQYNADENGYTARAF